jgi:hypothetical protein
MSLISKQDKELAIEALEMYAGELIAERELCLESFSEEELSHLQAKIRSLQTLRNWIMLDLAKSNMKAP